MEQELTDTREARRLWVLLEIDEKGREVWNIVRRADGRVEGWALGWDAACVLRDRLEKR